MVPSPQAAGDLKNDGARGIPDDDSGRVAGARLPRIGKSPLRRRASDPVVASRPAPRMGVKARQRWIGPDAGVVGTGGSRKALQVKPVAVAPVDLESVIALLTTSAPQHEAVRHARGVGGEDAAAAGHAAGQSVVPVRRGGRGDDSPALPLAVLVPP